LDGGTQSIMSSDMNDARGIEGRGGSGMCGTEWTAFGRSRVVSTKPQHTYQDGSAHGEVGEGEEIIGVETMMMMSNGEVEWSGYRPDG